MSKRVTHKHVESACERYNSIMGFHNWNDTGRLQWSDIRGDGTSLRNLYATCNANGGVGQSHLRGKTMRETIANIECAIALEKLPDYAVIVRCIYEREKRQLMALAELNRRGLWLSKEQRAQAELKGDSGNASRVYGAMCGNG